MLLDTSRDVIGSNFTRNSDDFNKIIKSKEFLFVCDLNRVLVTYNIVCYVESVVIKSRYLKSLLMFGVIS